MKAAPISSPCGARTKPERRIRKILRVMAYALAVCGVAGVLAANSAYGSMQDGALEIGAELDKLGDIGSKIPIHLNGQPIHVGSAVLDLSVSETLDRAELLCTRGSRSPGEPGVQGIAPDGEDLLLDTGGKPAMGIVREERDGRGVVLCFAPSEEQPAPDGIEDRMQRWLSFFATGDLDRLGRLRYVYAKETDAGRTHVVRVWTDAPFNLYAFTGTDGGDAPGSDPHDVPRPPESRRLLSATVETAIYAVRIYETRLSPSAVAAAYDETMPERGWELSLRDGDARIYTRRDVSVFVSLTEREGRSLVSLLHMGNDPSAPASLGSPSGPAGVAQDMR